MKTVSFSFWKKVWISCLLSGFVIFSLEAATPLVSAERDATPTAPILPEPWQGWSQAIRLRNQKAEAVLIPSIGRLVHFAQRGSDNLFRMNEELVEKPLAPEGRFFNIGGDWIWPVSQEKWPMFSDNRKDWPPPEALADSAWEASAWKSADGSQYALLTREYEAPLYIKASRLFHLAPKSAVLNVYQKLERTAHSAVPVVLWNISQIDHAEIVVFPVNPASVFSNGVTALMGDMPDEVRLSACGEVRMYHVMPGSETKLGADPSVPWIAAIKGNQLILESFTDASPSSGAQPDGGCTVEMYSNHGLGYTEIETLSPEILLEPGHVLENTLRMETITIPADLQNCELTEWIIGLVKKNIVPKNPAADLQTLIHHSN